MISKVIYDIKSNIKYINYLWLIALLVIISVLVDLEHLFVFDLELWELYLFWYLLFVLLDAAQLSETRLAPAVQLVFLGDRETVVRPAGDENHRVVVKGLQVLRRALSLDLLRKS